MNAFLLFYSFSSLGFLAWVWMIATFSSLQDSSQYFGRSLQYCSLDDLHLSSYFQILMSLYQSFGDGTKNTNNNWYHRYIHVPLFFNSFASLRHFIIKGFWTIVFIFIIISRITLIMHDFFLPVLIFRFKSSNPSQVRNIMFISPKNSL